MSSGYHVNLAVKTLPREDALPASRVPRVLSARLRRDRQLVLPHNHPSGASEPSHADELITQPLKEALALVHIRVLDHVVTGAQS